MKKLRINLLSMIGLFVILLSTACVSTRPANNINKAERRIVKYNNGIQNQIERFPTLANKAYTIIKEIRVEVPGDSVKLNLLLQNIAYLDSINNAHLSSTEELDSKIDSLSIIFEDSLISLDDQRIVVKNLLSRISKLNRENRILFEKYNKECIVNQDGTYVDDSFIVDYRFIDGILTMNIKSKDKIIDVETEVKKFDIKIRKHFWQDIKFYGFLLILLNVFYFFPNIISSIFSFIRKLFLKV